MEPSISNSALEADSSIKPPRISIKQRVSRACDGCRLHKTRCDGLDPCTTCSRFSRVCSYSAHPSHIKDPKVRTRLLQQQLSKAQQVIRDLETPVPGQSNIDHPTHRDPTLSPASTTSLEFVPASSSNRSSHADRGDQDTVNHTLVHSLLRAMSDDPNITSLLISATAHFSLPNPLITQEYTPQIRWRQTPYSKIREIVCRAFGNVFALCTVVSEKDFHTHARRLYEIGPTAYQPDDMAFMSLFFAVIALGLMYSSDLYLNLEYHQLLRESEFYSTAAMTSILAGRDYENLLHLRIALCHILHLLNTSRLDAAKSALQDVCSSLMVQQLVRSVSTRDPSRIDFSDASSRNIVWTIFYLDMHISSLSEVSSILPLPGPEMATVYAINLATYNVANYRRSESAFLVSVSVAMAIELLKLTQLMSREPGMVELSSRQRINKGKAPMQDSSTRDELIKQCETWGVLLEAIFPDDDCNPTFLMVRRQLQSHFYLTQINLYHLFLRPRSQPPSRHDASRDDGFKEGKACSDAAVDAVRYTSSYLERDQINVISWHSAYIVFISTVTLFTATIFMDPPDRGLNQDAIETAILILSTTTYGSRHAQSCYTHFIQKLSGILNPSPLSEAPLATSTVTRGSSRLSDTSTLVAANDVPLPFVAYPDLTPTRLVHGKSKFQP